MKAGGFSEDVEDRMKDVDLCLKLEKLGYRNVYEPGIAVILQDHQRGRKQGCKTGCSVCKEVEKSASDAGQILQQQSVTGQYGFQNP